MSITYSDKVLQSIADFQEAEDNEKTGSFIIVHAHPSVVYLTHIKQPVQDRSLLKVGTLTLQSLSTKEEVHLYMYDLTGDNANQLQFRVRGNLVLTSYSLLQININLEDFFMKYTRA